MERLIGAEHGVTSLRSVPVLKTSTARIGLNGSALDLPSSGPKIRAGTSRTSNRDHPLFSEDLWPASTLLS